MCHSSLIFQELGIYNFKINIYQKQKNNTLALISSRLERLSLIVDSISLYGQHRFFLNNSLDNLVKNLGENDYHVIRGFNADVSGLVKKEGFLSYGY